jgi:hypothetical protein
MAKRAKLGSKGLSAETTDAKEIPGYCRRKKERKKVRQPRR